MHGCQFQISCSKKTAQSELIRLVDQVLLVHRGPILHFGLSSSHLCNEANEAIGQWMPILSRNGIKKLNIRKDCDDDFLIPSSFFSCLALEDVVIFNSTIHVPPSFLGFKFLRDLELIKCSLTGITVARLISSCPLLESLDLVHLAEYGRLVIRAPNLRWLGITGEFGDLCLETPKLRFAHINLNGYLGYFQNFSLGSLSAIEELELYTDFITYLAKGPIPEVLSAPFYRLTKLVIELHPFKEEIAVAICLFKSAPNLKELSLGFDDNNYDPSSSLLQSSWEVRGTESNLFNCLEIVNIYDFKYPEPFLEVAKFVMSTARVREAEYK